MKSPFPAMEPYPEGATWTDAHSRLTVAISNALSETIDDRYVVRVETAVVEADGSDEGVRLLFPDVSVLHARQVPDDPDAVVDLQPILERIYQQARYGNDIDYTAEPPPPPLSPEDAEWARVRIAEAPAPRR